MGGSSGSPFFMFHFSFLILINYLCSMDINFQKHLPEDFADNSRVWIYQAGRMFGLGEAFKLQEILNEFIQEWHAHGKKVKGYANLFFGRFIILMADESETVVSGCSTDSSVRMIKEVERLFNIDMFSRTNLAFIVKDKIEAIPLSQVKYALEHGFLHKDTLYFNNTISTKKELEENWLIPVKDSWLKDRIPSVA